MKFYIQDDFLLDVSSVAFVGESQVILHGGGVINISKSWAPAIRRQVRGYADLQQQDKEVGNFVTKLRVELMQGHLELMNKIICKLHELHDQGKLKIDHEVLEVKSG
jgi:hypothetical protein